uniref:Uncharacterized protein n=1 Tax=Mycena chlorophos TaxID=658473 RepID=A0ABQ0L3K4_MYCCL|nr:predicted protein [Mycena chlorophos]
MTLRLLPSQFQGGQHMLQHGEQKNAFCPAKTSNLNFSTTVIAAYTGVEHTIAPISSAFLQVGVRYPARAQCASSCASRDGWAGAARGAPEDSGVLEGRP